EQVDRHVPQDRPARRGPVQVEPDGAADDGDEVQVRPGQVIQVRPVVRLPEFLEHLLQVGILEGLLPRFGRRTATHRETPWGEGILPHHFYIPHFTDRYGPRGGEKERIAPRNRRGSHYGRNSRDDC